METGVIANAAGDGEVRPRGPAFVAQPNASTDTPVDWKPGVSARAVTNGVVGVGNAWLAVASCAGVANDGALTLLTAPGPSP